MKKAKIAALLFAAIGAIHAAEKQPAWVLAPYSVYPEKDWLCVVESAQDKAQAEAKASGSLAQIFKIDVQAANGVRDSLASLTQNGANTSSRLTVIEQQIKTSTNVTGLMGVVHEFWTDKNKTVYALARINRKSGAASYAALIKENDAVISALVKNAAAKGASFDAYQSLTMAAGVAALTDNYLEILSVLNPAERENIKTSYGNKTAVKNRAAEVGRSLVIAVQVQGDDSGRVKKAFQEVITKRGFKTLDKAANAYTLNVDYEVSEVVLAGNAQKFARYVLNASLTDAQGIEALSFSANGRAGWSSYTEAAQKALRNAEAAIGDIENPESFAALFEEYLSSLLS